MSMLLSSLHTRIPTNSFWKIPPRIQTNNHSFPVSSCSLTVKTKHSNKLQSTAQFHDPYKKTVGVNGFPLKFSGFTVKAQNESNFSNDGEKEELEVRGQSSMPERFRNLTTEAPDKPVRWPWLIVLALTIYAWRTVLWELSNWKRSIAAILGFIGYLSKLIFAIIYQFIGDPITTLIRGAETTLYTIRAFYSSIIAYAPIQELTTIIILTSLTLSIAEATVPDSVNSQPYLLTFAGLIGFAAVKNYITEIFFWTLLLGLFGFAKLVKKRDYVSSALPVAAVLSAVGEPWVRVTAMGLYLGLAIFYHSKNSKDVRENEENGIIGRIPIPLVCSALAVGVRVAAKWAGYRHLTWMVV